MQVGEGTAQKPSLHHLHAVLLPLMMGVTTNAALCLSMENMGTEGKGTSGRQAAPRMRLAGEVQLERDACHLQAASCAFQLEKIETGKHR